MTFVLIWKTPILKEKLMWLLLGNFWRKKIWLLFILTSVHTAGNICLVEASFTLRVEYARLVKSTKSLVGLVNAH